jgi:hypothetical protein
VGDIGRKALSDGMRGEVAEAGLSKPVRDPVAEALIENGLANSVST